MAHSLTGKQSMASGLISNNRQVMQHFTKTVAQSKEIKTAQPLGVCFPRYHVDEYQMVLQNPAASKHGEP